MVSLNADVQFRLRSGYAKSFRPYIDSMTRHTYVDEDIRQAASGTRKSPFDQMTSTEMMNASRLQIMPTNQTLFRLAVRPRSGAFFFLAVSGVPFDPAAGDRLPINVLEMMPERAGEPSDKMDGPAAVGQFLREVSLVDLVVELVQNELDARATRTSIEFAEQALVCEGNGEPLDVNAWGRLESVIGAGGDVEAKRDGIGSKNHGLRSLFRLADRIGVQSAGLRADLTVRGDLTKPKRFKPAFWPREVDATAPPRGTRIVAPYRSSPIRVPDGDDTTLQPPSAEQLDALWRDAVSEAPERFVAASKPGAPWRYTLTLSRHELGRVDFTFECSPLRERLKGLWLRTCRVRRDGGPSRTELRRHALRFRCEIFDGGKVPRLFRAGGRVWGEVNWRVDPTGRPQCDRGRLRYPIAFTGSEARSGHGFDIAAPFIAGRSRRDISTDPRNASLAEEGRRAFGMSGELLGRAYGLRASILLRGLEPRETDTAAERSIVAHFIEHGGLRAAVFGRGAVPPIKDHRVLAAGSDLVLPVGEDARPATLRTVAALASATGAVVHPDTPAFVREHLDAIATSQGMPVRFDIASAARLVLIGENAAEGAVAETAVQRTAAALQLLDAARRSGGVPGDLSAALAADGMLPTFDGQMVGWNRARRLDRPPPIIPGVALPPVISQAVAGAAVLQKDALLVKAFRLDDYLANLDFNPTVQVVRHRFFGWLAENATSLKGATLRRLAEKPVWPGADGHHRPLDAYCHPKARVLRQLLAVGSVAPAPALVALLGSRRLPANARRSAWPS